ncbi:MAG: class I SAM-dependent methyltransferase [Thermoplasmata archaeon]
MTSAGLDEREWHDVIDTLEKVVDYYDKMNDVGTFLQAERWRSAAAKYSGDELDVLEVGCGPGTFAKHLLARRLVCLDPSEKLLGVARRRVGNRAEYLLGQAEKLPFDDEEFNRVFCSFSYRDLKDQLAALSEFRRVLRRGGKLVVLDIAKYDNGIMSHLMNLYLHHVVPRLTKVIVPKKIRRGWDRNPYNDLWSTYRQFKTPEQIVADVRDAGFDSVVSRILSLGGAFLIVANRS